MDTSLIKDPEARRLVADLLSDLDRFESGDLITNDLAEKLLDGVENFGPDPGMANLDTVIGRWSISFEGTAWNLAKALSGLVLAAASADGLSKLDAAKKVLAALYAMKDIVRRLEEGEKQVCTAIASIEGGQHWRSHDRPGATVDQIKDYFDQAGAMAPNDLQSHIDRVVEKKAVNMMLHPDAGKTYRMVL